MKLRVFLLVFLLFGCSKSIVFVEQETYVLHIWSSDNVQSDRISEVRLSDSELNPVLTVLQKGAELERVDSVTGDGVVLVGNDQFIVITQANLFYIDRKYIDSVVVFRADIEPEVLRKIRARHGIGS